MGFTGENQSPALAWEHAPAGTQSFAVTIFDLDAPTGSGFWHWVIFNIPASVTELKAGAGDLGKPLAPAGAVQSNTDFGQPGYVGAARPRPAAPLPDYGAGPKPKAGIRSECYPGLRCLPL
ncbi:YbhB/YbcL family Raf kinase inhibitor-like protein [Hymenobacter sp. AT01-02]|uniref:YbhB/YbcL family Raf kinase inhibitor-like protein n=1 Tax=Hymenobacter sp. AT01-02 TaxID=1571877 RepID=UPI00191BEF10|nr:YbhB/YbcL family Raf kinase inhibitor-like protein [Hymenobacter sp. AT01-02]